MSDFRDVLRAELVAAAERPLPRAVRMPARPVLIRTALVAAAVAAIVLGAIVLPRGTVRPSQPALHLRLPGTDLFGGSLDPGVRYRTRALQPPISFRANGDRWFVEDATSHDGLLLQWRGGRLPSGEVAPVKFLGFFRLTRVIDPGTGTVEPAPDDLVGWLRANPDLGVTHVSRTTLFGRPATRLDFQIPQHPQRVDPNCSYNVVSVDTGPLRLVHCAQIGPDFAAAAGSAGRLIVPDGKDPLMVSEGSFIPSRVGEIVRDAKPLLDSVLIGR